MRPVYGLLISFLIIGVLFQIVTPLFETPDEIWHVGMAAHLARGGGLPVQRPGEETPWRQEGSQPPLYYTLLAALTRLLQLPLGDLEAVRLENRHAAPGNAELPDNKNMVLHGSWERFPWRGAVGTLHIWRLLSLLLGATTVGAAYAAVRVMAPGRPRWALGAAALTAWNPMFPFIMGAINNDTLINALSALTLWQLARLWRYGMSSPRALLLGLLLGLAALSKLSGLALWAFTAGVLFVLVRKGRLRLPELLRYGGLIYGIAIALSGWWFLRNWVLYGDPTGLNVMLEIFGRRTVSPVQLLAEARGFVWSFWAVWGWFNILADPPVYLFLEAWLLLSAIGAMLSMGEAWRKPDPEARALWAGALGYTGLVFAGLVRWTSMTSASQGRLMFPAIGPIAWMLWVGWEHIVDRWLPRGWTVGRWAPAVIWMAIAWIAPVRYILPTYAGPMSIADLPPEARQVEVTFNRHLRLLGYLPGAARPGGSLTLTLFWECLQSTEQPWSVFLHPVLTPRVRDVRQVDRHPGRGLFSTTDCRPGFRFADPYWVPIGAQNEVPTMIRLHVGLYDAKTGWVAPAWDGQGRPIPYVILEAGKLRGTMHLSPVEPLDVRVGPARVIGVDRPAEARAGETITVTLYWEVEAASGEDWRVFVHLGDPDRPPRAQHDGPPALGELPSGWWEPGDRFADPHPLRIPVDLPPGLYSLRAGLYRPDGGRAEVIESNGERPPHRAVELGAIRVLP
ncbi:hypothetical protein [Thermoflexus sp.]|uniref:hypothetical protein n=1 Tax=Thermoflexus sp. TaxID=1969742 RepID=UPI00174FF15E|nr:hypothetical protein [Thermoflexus sp.]